MTALTAVPAALDDANDETDPQQQARNQAWWAGYAQGFKDGSTDFGTADVPAPNRLPRPVLRVVR